MVTRAPRWMIIVVFAGLALVATPTDARSAKDATGGASAGEETVVTADEAFEEDAQAYAELHGLGIEQARERLADETSFAAEVSRISEAHPDEFVVARVDHGKRKLSGTVLLTDDPGEELGARFDVEGMAVTIRTDAPMSEAVLLKRLDTVQRALVRSGYTDIVGVPDLERGTLHYEVRIPRSRRAMTATQLRSSLPAPARAPGVSVNFSERSLGALESVYGGALTPHSNTNSKCTTGFTVKKNGVSGFLTAGHCANNRDVWDHSAGVRVNAPFKAQHRGSWGDFQWHTSSRSEGARFYADWGRLRDHSARRTPSLGQTLCVFGRTSGRKCHEVYKIGVSNTFDGITHRRQVAMHRHVTSGGDSGGPWYASTNGYGVHSGWKRIWGIRRSMFSQARYMDEALGVRPKTR